MTERQRKNAERRAFVWYASNKTGASPKKVRSHLAWSDSQQQHHKRKRINWSDGK